LSASESHSRRELFTWVPLGLWLGTVLAALRAGALVALGLRRAGTASESARELARWEVAARLPELVLQGAIVGLLVAVMARIATADGTGPRAGIWTIALFCLAAILSVLSGWPVDAPLALAGMHGTLALDDLLVQLVLGLLLVAVSFNLTRWLRGEGGMRALLRGPLGATLAIAAFLSASAFAWWRFQSGGPTYRIRVVHHDWLADRAAWRVLETNAARGPELAILSPAAASEVDSGDKPALWMPPPCTIELEVPDGAQDLVLRAAAGVDKSVREAARTHGAIAVDFEVRLDGEEVFRERIVSAPETAWTPKEWTWHHVGGGEGLRVRPGQVLTLRTSFPEGDPGRDAPPELVRAGFAPLVLERSLERRRQRPRPETPNIVLIVMDTQRADRMSCYGYRKGTTPNLDALAARGMLFGAAHSTASWTWPATASILTGLGADEHGVLDNDASTLQLAFTTLAEVLQQRGYTTAAFSRNPLIAPARYFDQGFETFDPPPTLGFPKSDEVMPAVLSWVRTHARTRFFLYLHLVDPHAPHAPHPEELARLGGERPDDFPENGMNFYTQKLLREGYPPDPEAIPAAHRQWISDVYDASVATGDRWLGELLRLLDALQLADRTVVAFTSDHGEELLDHGLLEHGHTVFRELVRVPLILAGPGIPEGVRVERTVSNRHLAPTLAQLGGARLPGLADGEFLLEREPEGAGRAIYQTSKGYWNGAARQSLYGITEDGWSLHWREPAAGADEPLEVRLFSDAHDAAQAKDRSAEEPEQVQRLLLDLREGVAGQRAKHEPFPVGVSPDFQRFLDEVGYGGHEEQAEDG